MAKLRVTFLVPAMPREVEAALGSPGWTVRDRAPGALPVGASVTASYDGGFPRSALSDLLAALDEAETGYVAVSSGSVDPAMDVPVAATVDVPREWRVGDGVMRLPRGFQGAAADVRTLVAAGLTDRDAHACLAAATGGVGAAARGAWARPGA